MKLFREKIIAFALCVAFCAGATVCFAANEEVNAAGENQNINERDTSFEAGLADDLKALGLFKGVSETEYELNRAPTRAEAVTMLVRLLGMEGQALDGTWAHPFSDIPAWAEKYVGYAYEKGLTKGVSEKCFGSNDTASANMYLTFTLRALNFSEGDDGDFKWNSPDALAKSCEILPERVRQDDFCRADVVMVSYAALQAKLKNEAKTLAAKLIAQGSIDPVQYEHTIDKLVFRNWSELSRDTKDNAILAITGREGFVVKKRMASPPFDCEVILGELNGNPELFLAYSHILGTGKGTGDGVVLQLPLPMSTKTLAATPDTIELISITKGRSDGLIYKVLFESDLIINQGTKSEETIHKKGTYVYVVNLNVADVSLRIENETEFPVKIHTMTVEERNKFESQTKYTPTVSTAYLSKNNSSETSGSVCAAFSGDKANMAFVMTSVPGATNYNVQLYEGLPGEGVRVSDYAAVEVNSGVYFTGLTVGQSYYLKLSSNTLTTDSCTAVYSMFTFD